MTVHDLSREEMIELKGNYMVELVNEGVFREVMNRDYDEPSWGDFADADEIIPDDLMFEHYGGIEFVEEDFWCNLKED